MQCIEQTNTIEAQEQQKKENTMNKNFNTNDTETMTFADLQKLFAGDTVGVYNINREELENVATETEEEAEYKNNVLQFLNDWRTVDDMVSDNSIGDYLLDLANDLHRIDDLPYYIVIDTDATVVRMKEPYAEVELNGKTWWVR